MANWKFIAGSAGFAFFISLLTGLFSGVQFGTLILRAFLGGAAFGGLAFGIDYIIKRYLPELAKAISPGQQEKGRSPNVDIVIEDENPPGREIVAGENETGNNRSGGYVSANGQSADESDLSAEDTGDNRPDKTDDFSLLDDNDNDNDDRDSSSEFVEEVEELGAAEESAAPPASSEDTEEVAELELVDDENATIDSLPDIDTLSDSFNYSEGVDDSYEETISAQDSGNSVDVGGVEQDPRVIAKAVQTMLKKD